MDEMRRLFAYDDWANREALRSLRGAPKAALRRMAHILGAQRTWLHRLSGGPPVEVWPDLSLDACEAQLDDLRERWRDHLGKEQLARSVVYTNTKGQRFEGTAREILMQVVLHGAYHRGQIAADVRAEGREPALTDYIHATRERHV